MVARLLDTAASLVVETLTQTGARGGLEASAVGCKLPAVVMRLGKKLGGNMTVMPPPAGMGEAALKERVAVLPAAPGKRSLAAMVKETLDICRVMEVEVEVEVGVVVGGGLWAWVPVSSRNAMKQIATGNTLAHIMFWTYRNDAL
jgi:hypothetical protein